jgi:hypothetical protein
MAQTRERREAWVKNATNPHFLSVGRGLPALQKSRASLSLLSHPAASTGRMHFFRAVRCLNTWSRALLVGFVLALGLNSVAHAAHQHDPASATTTLHSVACGYCVAFDHLASAPNQTALRLIADLEFFVLSFVDEPLPSVRARSSAQPRAPPVLI